MPEQMTLRKAAEDMLNRYVSLVNCGDCGYWNPEEEKEVIALRQALAQPEQETEKMIVPPVPEYAFDWCNLKKVELFEDKQDPVAWKVTFFDDNHISQLLLLPHPVHPKSNLAKRSYEQEPLYTAPPKHEWVGLDEDRVAYLADKYAPPIDPAFTKDDDYWRFYQEIEAELKEKNCGA